MRLGIAALILGAVLAGTGCDDRSAGGSFETENLTAFVVSVDSLVPAGRRLGEAPLVATVRLDSSNFDFSHVSIEGRGLSVERMDGRAIPFFVTKWKPFERWARIQVRLEGDLLRGGRRFRVAAKATESRLSDSTAVWRGALDSAREEWTSTLVDDFESGTLRTRLPTASYWYTNKADSASISEITLAAAEGERKGTALRFEYNAPVSRHDYVLVGASLGKKPINFRSLDSIVFWAKGSGIFSVSLDNQLSPGGSKTWAHDDLTAEWKRWRIGPDDFDPANSTTGNGNLGWQSVHDSVTALSFFATGSGTVMLDDIRFYGMEEDDFR